MARRRKRTWKLENKEKVKEEWDGKAVPSPTWQDIITYANTYGIIIMYIYTCVYISTDIYIVPVLYIYVMYNELYEHKDTEWNITLLLLFYYFITVYLIQLCSGGTTLPTSPPPRCRLLSVAPRDFKFFFIYTVQEL